jgi:hypothetical protein
LFILFSVSRGLLCRVENKADGSECADFDLECAFPDRDGLAGGAAAQIHGLHLLGGRSLGKVYAGRAGFAGLFLEAQDGARAAGI